MNGYFMARCIFPLSQEIILNDLGANFEEGGLLIHRVKVIEQFRGDICWSIIKGLNEVFRQRRRWLNEAEG